MFETSIAGSLPKPAWLAETNKLWPQWKAEGDALRQAKADATLLWIKAQEDAGLDIVCDGEQSRQHFVHGFLEQVEGIDFDNKVKMGIRDNRYDAMVPQVTSPLRLKGRVHAFEAQLARAHVNFEFRVYTPTFDEATTQPLEFAAGIICCFLKFNERDVLDGAGRVSKKQADAHAESQYEQFAAQRRALLEAEGAGANVRALEDAAKALPKPGLKMK